MRVRLCVPLLPTFRQNVPLCRRSSAIAKVCENSQEWREAKPFSEIPGPKELPLIKGVLWYFDFDGFGRERLTQMHRKNYKTYGEIWRLPKVPFLKDSMVVLHNPQAHATVYQNEGRYPNRNFFRSVKVYRDRNPQKYINAGVVAENGKEWHSIRSKVQPFFLKKSLLGHHISSLDEVSLDFVNMISTLLDQNQETTDFIKDLYKWALESIATVALDTRLGCLDANTSSDSEAFLMISAVNQLFHSMSEVEIGIPLYKIYNTKEWKEFCAASDTLARIGMKYINKKMETLDRSEPGNYSTILEGLLSVEGLDQSVALVTVLDMLGAGIDTTSHAMGFLLYHLGNNQEVQDRMFHEISKELPHPSSPITKANLENLKYVKAAIRESMRISPVVDTGSRIVECDLIIHGYQIPKGTVCLLHQSVTSNSTEYFDDPDKFLPERWLKTMDNKAKPNAYTTLPFGHGPRMCIGRRIADMEMWLLTIRLLQRFRVEYHHEPIQRIQRIVGLPDRPLRLQFHQRY